MENPLKIDTFEIRSNTDEIYNIHELISEGYKSALTEKYNRLGIS
jgi:hypothetical protein